MSVRTRTVEAPGRVARRVQDAERVKSGAAQRAYARRRLRAESGSDTAFLPTVRRSAMAARIPFVTAIIALLGCGLALTLLLTTRAAEDSYQLGDARATNRRLADERAALQREVEAADSAPELAARARELGMIPARDPARLLVGPDGSVTVIGKPTPAQGTPVPPLNASPSARPWGERVVPVTTTPGAPAPGRPSTGPQNPQVNAAPAPGSPVPTSPAAVVPPSALPAPPAEAPQPPAETVPRSDAAQPETAPGGVPQ
ncbi:SLAIN motif-containing protein [Nocardia abscessus]|uniref:SLAIN motif-containing protein n=1 Tax=Nocardia abscessus TaxID=120957 RepID=UPI001E374D31|nr:SLAIN motif-containing protein [Nocardia abscessus]